MEGAQNRAFKMIGLGYKINKRASREATGEIAGRCPLLALSGDLLASSLSRNETVSPPHFTDCNAEAGLRIISLYKMNRQRPVLR